MTTTPQDNTDVPDSAARFGRRARWAVRVVCLVVAIVALLPAVGGTRWPLWIPSLSPWVALCTLVATHALHASVMVGLIVAAVTIARHRFFCRWVCPTGTCAAAAGRLGKCLGRSCPRWPRVGQWIALVTLGGAAVGYPLLLWLDPLALLAGSFNLLRADLSAGVGWSVAGVATVLVIGVVWPGLWCARLCPLGATQDLLWWSVRWRPQPNAGSPSVSEGRRGWSRRAVLGAAAGTLAALAVRRAGATPDRPLRPPGSADEAHFAGLCVRCGNCLRACPADIILPELGDTGVAGLLTPTLDFQADYCREDCIRCTDVCPSGALTQLTIDDKLRRPIGLPVVDMNLCLLGDDRDCSVCRNWCPYEAITLEFCEIEYTLTPRIDLARCPGCGACELACPTQPHKAITIQPIA